LRENPAAYLQILYWRLRGLRLRSRQHFAALVGRSSAAYDLWLENRPFTQQSDREPPSDPPFRAMIDCSGGSEQLPATLASLRAAGLTTEPLLVGGQAAATCATFREASLHGDKQGWLVLLVAGDRIAPDALASYARAVRPSVNLLYADDDLVDASGRRHAPHLKPDWNPDLFMWHDYVTGSCAIRGAAVPWETLEEQNWVEAAVHAALRSGTSPVHIRHILHHRRVRPEARRPGKAPPLAPLPAPSVTVIIPTRNGLELLRPCMEGVARTAYPSLEVIVVDNGSDEPATLDYLRELEAAGIMVLRLPGPFNYSFLNNRAVDCATGEFCCFLNNDIEVVDPHWLIHLVAQAQREDLGAVGARLLYPDQTIQHAGVVIGIGGAAGHAHRLQPAADMGYFARAHLPQQVSAVTAACMLVSKEKFVAVGGFDEQEFPVAFNDVDLCLRLNERGWQCFYEPRATLVHHESLSRGRDDTPDKRLRFNGELAALRKRWLTDRRRDPYHHPDLSALSETFVLDLQ
jgi:GT2 family glycosyltransferase